MISCKNAYQDMILAVLSSPKCITSQCLQWYCLFRLTSSVCFDKAFCREQKLSGIGLSVYLFHLW